MGFGDDVAHEMALLAMEQYGLALAGRFSRLMPARTPLQAGVVHAAGRIALWLPGEMTTAAPIAASWDVTSDSLAAFYAKAAGAARLLLIKSVDLDAARLDDLVDRSFASYADGLDVFIAGPCALEEALETFSRGDVPGTGVALAVPQRKSA